MRSLRNVTSLLLLSLTLNYSPALASHTEQLTYEEEHQLAEVLESCDTALKQCHQAREAQVEQIRVRDEALESSHERTAELQSEMDSPFNNKWLWFMIGILTGAGAVIGIGGR